MIICNHYLVNNMVVTVSVTVTMDFVVMDLAVDTAVAYITFFVSTVVINS